MANNSGEAEEPGDSDPTAVPMCALEEWSQNFGIQDGVRYLVLLWAGPASAMLATGLGALDDPSRLSALHDSLTFSRAWFATLTVFTTLVGAMWLVRSDLALPSFRELGPGRLGWRLHAIAAAAFVAFAAVTPLVGPMSTIAWVLAVASACVAASGVARWLSRLPLAAAQPLAGLSLCVAFEMTFGWLSWHPVSGIGVAALAGFAVVRALVLIGCVLGATYALAAGHWPPVVDSATTFAHRMRRID